MAATYEEARLAQRSRRSADTNFEAYKTWPHFTHRTQKGRVQWMVLKPGWMDVIGSDSDAAWIDQLQSEGKADSLEEAWAAAVAEVGTDEIYIAHSGLIQRVVSARAQLKREARWAKADVKGADAAPARYVYSHKPSRYLQGQDPYPYRRHRVVKETTKLLFIDAGNFGEEINAQGEPSPDARVIGLRDKSTYRVKKADFEVATDYSPIGSADMGSGWNITEIWLELDGLVERVNRWLPQYVDNTPGGGQWRVVLGLPIEDHLTPADVKRAYRRSLLRAHPDHGGSREQLEAVQEAYEVGKRLVEAG